MELHDSGGYLPRIREFCLSLPATSERLSHGAPTFFIEEKRSFAAYRNNHHGDGKVALWCAAPPGAQSTLVASAPDWYYIPAYVGHLGWVGLRLDRDAGWDEIAGAIESAYLARAPKKWIDFVKERRQRG
ncbi:phosphoribosylglycinamide formyltransferase [Gordoniibacillus kamchatkensis]|uniref:Phosphoribosylglycinamide formyltransferase n=1 Tax=Gordoniibacillus kamchatkensis TaxID=1590651 RepID=A0ABR5ABW5_9BACL|nr:MmcQ/YjbR family DNA-binding protein [Paenibacillus sp. VKM B-2647]KIL37872.1 phosphoribosylglycinamide formyltransferase [Paenibacillus sp. VKM B-2647]